MGPFFLLVIEVGLLFSDNSGVSLSKSVGITAKEPVIWTCIGVSSSTGSLIIIGVYQSLNRYHIGIISNGPVRVISISVLREYVHIGIVIYRGSPKRRFKLSLGYIKL